MVNCPRCEFPVDETTRTTCPLCFTPITPVGDAQIPVSPQTEPAPAVSEPTVAPPSVAVAVETPAMQTPVVPVMPPPEVPAMAPPAVPMPPQQMAPPVQPAYAPPPQTHQIPPQPMAAPMPPQVQQMPGMYQAQQQGGGMPQAAPPAQPQYTPGSAPRPGVRVSLTGEVIDDSMNSAPPPSYVGGTLPPPRPVGQAPAGAARRPVREEAPDASKGNPVAAVILVIMLVVGLGFGGWWFLSHRTNPKDQALKVYTAMLKADWGATYDLLDKQGASDVPSRADFIKKAEEQLNANPQIKMAFDMIKNSASDFAVGEPVYNSGEADVPTSCKMTIMGQTLNFKGTAHMVNRGGVWLLKVGNSFNDGSKIGQDLIGKPDNIPGGMMGGGGMGGGMMRR